ncbi:hypothetical protein BDQ17DRAFT_1338220 [Cyathus striatus]|nr:hypothetical protein BDQ17DRAFT_1338220 [Cyathus striatus]
MSSAKPEFIHQPTSGITLVTGVESKSKDTKENVPAIGPSKNSAESTNGVAAESIAKRRFYDILLLGGIFIMLIWPWIFFGVVFSLGGIQAGNHFANVVNENPHAVNFFVTLIGNVITLIVDVLFSFSILRFAQEWISDNKGVNVFHVSLISALRHHKWQWKIEDLKHLFVRNRWLLVTLVGVFIVCFTFVPSSVTSLINPVNFNRTTSLSGTEIDLSSISPDCINWLASNPIKNQCDWETYNGLDYTTCLGENQMVDVLEAGRGHILSSLPNNTQSLTFSQLSNSSLHFLGPIRGVLPIGPNGVPAFDTLNSSAFSIPSQRAAMISYNYTLEHQGLSSNVTCSYDTTEHVNIYDLVPPVRGLYQYSGTCDPDSMENIFEPDKVFVSISSNNTLAFWTCKSKQTDGEQPSYYIYLRGLGVDSVGYRSAIGNMTCTVSPIQPAIFNVTYQSAPNHFISEERISTSPIAFPGFLDRAMLTVGGVVWEAQNWESNLVAESVITFGVKSFGLPAYDPSDQYLRLYEAMIQGILEYEATYSRLLYSTFSGRPPSCTRMVNGVASFEVFGWSVDNRHVGFLMPLTLVNLAALVILIIAIVVSKTVTKRFDPTDIRPLLVAYIPKAHGPDDLGHIVTYDDMLKIHRKAREKELKVILKALSMTRQLMNHWKGREGEFEVNLKTLLMARWIQLNY